MERGGRINRHQEYSQPDDDNLQRSQRLSSHLPDLPKMKFNLEILRPPVTIGRESGRRRGARSALKLVAEVITASRRPLHQLLRFTPPRPPPYPAFQQAVHRNPGFREKQTWQSRRFPACLPPRTATFCPRSASARRSRTAESRLFGGRQVNLFAALLGILQVREGGHFQAIFAIDGQSHAHRLFAEQLRFVLSL